MKLACRLPRGCVLRWICCSVWLWAGSESAWAQTPANKGKEEPKLGWSDAADLSLVLAVGNSDAQTLGFSNRLRHVWRNARFELDLTATRAYTSDDRYYMLTPGQQFPVGATLGEPPTTLVTPEPELDVANYLASTRYERNMTRAYFWNVGLSWDSNKDAGIVHRYIGFAGIGHTWTDTTRRRFAINYGLSYTDRKEEHDDPEKESRFAGARLGWDYTERFGTTSTTFDSTLVSNVNFKDPSDYSINTTNSFSVSINTHLSLKVSLQLLFENTPALETDLDVVAIVELLNPDGIPSSGDESFRTVESGGTKIVLGAAEARKEKLDTIFRTSFVMTF